jgi:hypothetical protein
LGETAKRAVITLESTTINEPGVVVFQLDHVALQSTVTAQLMLFGTCLIAPSHRQISQGWLAKNPEQFPQHGLEPVAQSFAFQKLSGN